MKLELTQGHFAEVDDSGFSRLSRFSWFLVHHKSKGLKYAARSPRPGVTIYLHSEILQSQECIDHRDRNGLNCCRSNLRFATYSQNGANRRKQKNNTSGFMRVSWESACQQWRARIKVHGKSVHLGLFDCPVEAAKASDKAAIQYFGEFASLNFPASQMPLKQALF